MTKQKIKVELPPDTARELASDMLATARRLAEAAKTWDDWQAVVDARARRELTGDDGVDVGDRLYVGERPAEIESMDDMEGVTVRYLDTGRRSTQSWSYFQRQMGDTLPDDWKPEDVTEGGDDGDADAAPADNPTAGDEAEDGALWDEDKGDD